MENGYLMCQWMHGTHCRGNPCGYPSKFIVVPLVAYLSWYPIGHCARVTARVTPTMGECSFSLVHGDFIARVTARVTPTMGKCSFSLVHGDFIARVTARVTPTMAHS